MNISYTRHSGEKQITLDHTVNELIVARGNMHWSPVGSSGDFMNTGGALTHFVFPDPMVLDTHDAFETVAASNSFGMDFEYDYREFVAMLFSSIEHRFPDELQPRRIIVKQNINDPSQIVIIVNFNNSFGIAFFGHGIHGYMLEEPGINSPEYVASGWKPEHNQVYSKTIYGYYGED